MRCCQIEVVPREFCLVLIIFIMLDGIFFVQKEEEKMVLKILMLVVFFAIMIGVGLYCRKHATDVNGFVLGGRSVGPWLTAFA